jgi:hypothetical protein
LGPGRFGLLGTTSFAREKNRNGARCGLGALVLSTRIYWGGEDAQRFRGTKTSPSGSKCVLLRGEGLRDVWGQKKEWTYEVSDGISGPGGRGLGGWPYVQQLIELAGDVRTKRTYYEQRPK